MPGETLNRKALPPRFFAFAGIRPESRGQPTLRPSAVSPPIPAGTGGGFIRQETCLIKQEGLRRPSCLAFRRRLFPITGLKNFPNIFNNFY